MDPVKRAGVFIKMNDLLDPERCRDPGALARPGRGRVQQGPQYAEQSPWESDFWNHATWYREA
jgi:hypothetical protein